MNAVAGFTKIYLQFCLTTKPNSNSMQDPSIHPLIEAAKHEILERSLDLTQQLLDACEIESDENGPKVVHVDYDMDEKISVYFEMTSEQHFVVVNIDVDTGEPIHAWMQNGHQFEFCVSSEDHSFEELASKLSLPNLTGWSKGDVEPASESITKHGGVRRGEWVHRFSSVKYASTKKPWNDFEESLAQLLGDLEQDLDAVIELGRIAESKITVARRQALMANAGYILSAQAIFRLNRLGLWLDIHQYISGNWSD